MFKSLRRKIASVIASEYITELETVKHVSEIESNNEVNRRVAEALTKMDVLHVLLKDTHATFSKEYERPEDKLNPQGRLSMEMWGYTQFKDPNFDYLLDWIIDTFANNTLRKADITPERILYGRAQIVATELIRQEVRRLCTAYEDRMEMHKPKPFDPHAPVGG